MVPRRFLLFEKRVPLLFCILGGCTRLADEVNPGAGFEIIAIVGLVLGSHPFRLCLAAFIVDGGIEQPAIFAAVKVTVARWTGFLLQHLLRREQRDRMPAIEAGECDIRHERILARKSRLNRRPAKPGFWGDGMPSPVV